MNDADNETDKLNRIVDKLVQATDHETILSTYHEWSDSYEHDLESFGYVAPEIVTDTLIREVGSNDATILDAGCGTGLVGALLSGRGYKNLHGRDFSQSMLDKAERHQCYSSLEIADYTTLQTTEDNTYDGIVSAGVYSKQLGKRFLSELLRMLKPGGTLIISCREHYLQEISNYVSTSHANNDITRSSIVYDHYMKGQSAKAYYFTLQKAHGLPDSHR